MVATQNQSEEFSEVDREWDILRLSTHLEAAKGRKLSPTLRKYLRGLLCGHSPAQIAEKLHLQGITVRKRLSHELYPDIEVMLECQTGNFVKVKDWHQVRDLLERAGYRKTPDGIALLLEAGLKGYVTLSEQYQLSDWQTNYKELAADWGNLQSVLQSVVKWCKSAKQYDAFRTLLQNLKEYNYIYGCWQERMDGLEWLIRLADQHDDRNTLIEATLEKGWLLILMNRENEAHKLFRQTADLKNPWLQLRLAKHQAVLHLRQQRFIEALNYLNQAQNLLPYSNLEIQRYQRWQTTINYYQAQVYFQQRELKQAESLYHKALEQAQSVGWHRMTVAIQNWLARGAIVRGELTQAKHLLESGLTKSWQYHDKQCIAFYSLSFARLNQAQGNSSEAWKWAEQASNEFTVLGMLNKAAEAKRLVRS